MPSVTIELFKGKDVEQKRKLVKKMTEAVCEVVGCAADAVTVRIVEGERENLAKGGVLYSDK